MREKNWRRIAIASLVALGLYVIGSLIYSKFETLEAQVTAQELAEPVNELCTNNAQARAQIGNKKCEQAAEVESEPDIPVVVKAGPPGRGIRETRIEDNNLIIVYTDDSKHNVGTVVGKPGEQGIPGNEGKIGRGITSTAIVNGQLQVNYSDNTSELLGTIVGEAGINGNDGKDGNDGSPGRGIERTIIIEGQLTIEYTDGTQDNIGPLPSGPPGPTCPSGTELLEREVTSSSLPPVQETWFVCVKEGE